MKSDFIVRSHIGWENELKTGMFGFATPCRRGKLCPISKKVGNKRRKWDVRSPKKSGSWDVNSPKMRQTLIRETTKMPCTAYNKKNITSKKEGKNEKKSKDVRFQKKVVKRLKMTHVP